MKLKHFFFLLSFAFSVAVSAQSSLPDVAIKSLDGKTVNAQDLGKRGKIVVLSFWATWCSPCKKELDAISEVYEDWQKKYNMDLVAITIDDARALSKVKPMVETKGWTFEVLSDVNGDLKRALNFPSVPQTFLINQEGKIVYSHSGYLQGDEDELEKHIAELVKK
jgi:cytochrome c biogenesis protein CcmG, thiol:disulfide interchange protein DsbE